MNNEDEAITTGADALSIAVPAAGCGVRAGLNGNKILAPLHGRPLLWWTLRNLTSAEIPALPIREVLIAARREEWPLIEAALPDEIRSLVVIIEGGANRQDSVFNLARAAQAEWIMVHDAARPLVSAELIQRVCAAALETGAALAALPASDTVKRASGSTAFVAETLERSTLWLAQTPQMFRRGVLLEALQQAQNDGFIGTDCASLVERLLDENGQRCQPVKLVEGEAANGKVTFAADLQRAELVLMEGQQLSTPPQNS